MLIKFIINLVEALIVSYSLSRLCHVKKQKLYFVLNTLMTFSIEIISDYFDANYAPLAIAYIICWNILLLFFTRKEYIYNLFMCIFNELLITLSALLPLMFISHYYLLLAAVEAKIYHLLLSVLFIRYQKRYRYFINKYWVLVMMNLTACLLILNLQGRIIMEGSYTFKTIMTIFLCIFVVFLSLTFFAFLEESNNEKEKVTKQLEERKYQNITYDMIRVNKLLLTIYPHIGKDYMKDYSINTKCVQAGYTPGNGEPRQIPIIQSTTFKYDTSEDMGKLFDLEASGYFYTRLQNPTNDHVAAKIAALECGTAAMLTSSGQAANFFALFNICECGSHIVASSSIYGGTFNLISVTLKKMGIDVTFVSPDATEGELNAAFKDNTRAMFGESIANPALTVLDIEKFAKAAHAHNVPLIVDNTFPTPVNCRPIEWGADIVTHSTTKYMDGHGAAVGGVIVDSGNFDWMAHADMYPGLCTPDESYHGITYAEKFGKEGAFITKCTSQLMRDLGCIQSPQNAFILNLGLESLHVRMPRHVENGQAVAEFLENHPKVEYVIYPGLKSSKYYETAKKYMPNGGCGVVSFEIKGGREAAEKFMKNLKLAAIETHVADARTCCLNPATSTHRQMNDEQLKEAGISAGLIRISCGLEDKVDLIADLAQAFDSI